METRTEDGTTIKVYPPRISTDIGQKIAETLENPPSNDEIVKTLGEAKESLEETRSGLDAKGQTIVKDAQELLDSASKLITEKNKDELLQNIFVETREGVQKNASAVQRGAKKVQIEGKKLAKEAMYKGSPHPQKLKADTEQLYGYIRNLLWNFLRSNDFRVLASEWVSLFQYMGTKKMKELANKEEVQEHDITSNIAKAIDEGLQQTQKPEDEEELEKKTEEKLNQLLERIRTKPEYHNAIREFFKLWDQLKERMEKAKSEMNKQLKESSSDVELHHFWDALYDAQFLLEEFVGKTDWEEFKEIAGETYDSVKDDPELKGWISDVRNLMNDLLDKPDEIPSELFKERVKEISQRGRRILQKEKWQNLFDKMWSQLNILLLNVKEDQTTNEFEAKLKKLGKDLVLNKSGTPDLFVMEDSLIQIKNIMIPLVKQQLEKINIGRIDFTNDTYDVTIQDIGFSGSFLPEHIDFRMRNDSHLDITDSSKDTMKHLLQFQVENIKPEFKNFKFQYRRKTFPKIEDYGVADMNITGDGAFLKITWKVESKGGEKPIATLSEVTCHIDKLQLKIIGEQTKHDILDTIMAPLLSKVIKNKISGGIEDFLRNKLGEVNDRVNSFLQSRPLDTLNEKANELMQEQYKKIQNESVDAK